MAPADVSRGKGFPLAPLFTTASIVPDEASNAVEQVDVSTAEATLNALDKAVRSFEGKSKLAIPEKSSQSIFLRTLVQKSWLIIRALTFLALMIAMAVQLQRSRDRKDTCEAGVLADWAVDPADSTRVVQGTLSLPLETVCRVTTGDDWQGAPQWRWLLFFALWPVLGALGFIIAWCISLAVLALEGSGLLLVLIMHDPLGGVIRAILWIISWRLLMNDAIKWSRSADEWEEQAGAPVWTDQFRDVHYYMLRALIAYLLFEIASLLRQTASSYVAVRFHHKKFFQTMQRALVQEHSVKGLSGPAASSLTHRLPLSETQGIPLDAMQAAHWKAVQFLTRFAKECQNIVQQAGPQSNVDEVAFQLRERAASVRMRLAAVLAASINAKSTTIDGKGESEPSAGGKEGAARSKGDDGADALVAITPSQPPVMKEEIVRAAVASLDGSFTMASGRAMSLKSAQEAPKELDDQNADEVDPPGNAVVELAVEAAQAFDELEGFRLTRMARLAANWTPQDVAAELASQKGKPTTKVWVLVRILQDYILQRPHIRVALHGDQHSKDLVESPQFARQLGYLMFFNLKRNDEELTISENEVRLAEKAAGLENTHAWRLFNRDGDLSSTLQEFMEGIERVYRERDVLASTLTGNVTVVRQVENAIGAVLLIVWVFIAAAIFDPGAVQRTWTALSAGLLSFSFIFSNTIRELFENAIYLFSVQPFAPGDAIVVEGTRYSVNHITLLSIELVRGDGAVITITTTAMRDLQVHNITRSGKLQEELQFSVDRGTPHDKLRGVAHHVQTCIRAHPRLYNGTYVMWWSAASGDKLQLSVAFDHKTNGLDLLKTQLAKTYMYDAVAKAFLELGIQWSSGLNLTFDGAAGGDAAAAGAARPTHSPPEGLDVVRVATGAAILEQM